MVTVSGVFCECKLLAFEATELSLWQQNYAALSTGN